MSKISLRLSFSHNKRPKVSIGPSSGASDIEVPDSQNEYESVVSDDSEDYEEDSDSVPTRGTRRGTKAVAKLPFSPKKMRSSRSVRRNYDESDEESEAPTRRSTRSRKQVARIAELSDEDYEKSASGSPAPAKKKRLAKASRSEYGKIRKVADLDISDDEEDPLKAHRAICEKCTRSRADKLKPKKKKKGRKRNSEDEEEEVTAETLGGWVRWSVCVLLLSLFCGIDLTQFEMSSLCPLVLSSKNSTG